MKKIEIIEENINRINEFLAYHLQNTKIEAQKLHSAISYVNLNAGKRIRANLVYLSGELFNANKNALDYAASAIELIHAYSLVHDDLPAMDDDNLRRGKPTCHIKFDEATAILAGDAMQSESFKLLSCEKLQTDYQISSQQQIKAISTLASHSTSMVSGQVLDLESEGKKISFDQLKQIHQLKTAKLITASLLLGFYFSDEYKNKDIENKLIELGENLGLAFQIQDDILDITSTTEILGKAQGSDLNHQKATYPSFLGLEKSKLLFKEKITNCYTILNSFENSENLIELINVIENRNF